MEKEQVFLKDWLVKQIDSGKYEGVEWLDKDQKIFKIPWTHSKKSSYRLERDAALFREWAIYRGRYKGDNAKEASAWKINFRCALHGVKNVIEMPELECTYASSKVYRLLPYELIGKKKGKWLDVLPRLTASNAPTKESSYSPSSGVIACASSSPGPLLSSDHQMVTGSLASCPSPNEAGSSTEAAELMETNILVVAAPIIMASNKSRIKVTIYYGSLMVDKCEVDCVNGCRFFYGALHDQGILNPVLEEDLFGPTGAAQLSLSPNHPLAVVRDDIFTNFKRGLLLTVDEGNIFATPLTPVVVYYGNGKDCAPLFRDEPTCVFDYKTKFLPLLGQYFLNKSQPAIITPFIMFSIGQPWSASRPSIYNPITIVVVPLWAEEEMAQLGVQLTASGQDDPEARVACLSQQDLIAEEFLNPSSP